jgi:hypothetical protein
MRQRKKPNPYSSYVALMCDLVNKEPTCFEEATQKKEWMNSTIEEYQSIMKYDMCGKWFPNQKTKMWYLLNGYSK